ncbi:uncharacterized protein BO96DRAFT_349303, partial [Aspergillus niger CBS 101883]
GCCSGTGPVSAEPFVSMTMESPGALRGGRMGGRTGRNDEKNKNEKAKHPPGHVSAGRAGLDVERMRPGKKGGREKKERAEENNSNSNNNKKKKRGGVVVNEKGNKQPERNRSEKLEWEIEGGRRKLKIPLEGARENERARRRAGDAGWARVWLSVAEKSQTNRLTGTRLPKALLGDLPVGARRRSGEVHPLPVAWYFKEK